MAVEPTNGSFFLRHPSLAPRYCAWTKTWNPTLKAHTEYVQTYIRLRDAGQLVLDEYGNMDLRPEKDRPKVRKEIKVNNSVEDNLSKMSIEELLKRAQEIGFVEQPFPNGGVRKMRLLNAIRNHRKQSQSGKA